MTSPPILITGATGRVGGALAVALKGHAELRLAGHGRGMVPLDFHDPATFDAALHGCATMFLMRPPQIASGRAFRPFLDAAIAAGVHRVVVLSVKGAKRNAVLPHHGLEREVKARNFVWTMLRPSDFMQNLETVHRAGICDRSEIAVPAGKGRSAFIDVGDVAAVAATTFIEPGHEGRGYTLTGSAALSFDDIAAIMSDVLGRPICYLSPGIRRFVKERRAEGTPLGMALVMSALYTVQRLGGASGTTDEVARLLGRPPVDFHTYAQRNRGMWEQT
jgi:uncharacterized protein YbjT (DUF2867 family)